MERKKTGLFLLALLLLMVGLTGCQKEKQEESQYHIYYIDKDDTKTVAVGYEPKSRTTEDFIPEMLKKLSEDTDDPGYHKSIPSGVNVESSKLENGQLYLCFNSAYSEIDPILEILCRASIVRTLVQAEGIESISFYIGDSPLVDVNGTVIGLMTADSFIENPGEQINAIQTADITLYFANKDGSKLVQEVQKVRYSSNISMEKLIMEQLLKGPLKKELRSAIPKGTKLVSVSVLDGVCFVNLNEGFLEPNYEIAEPVVIYSIVNSLVELPNINKVQIAVNGDSNQKYREKFNLETAYDRNLDYMDTNAQTQEEQIEDNMQEKVNKDGKENAGD